jgi:hypothetical protein
LADELVICLQVFDLIATAPSVCQQDAPGATRPASRIPSHQALRQQQVSVAKRLAIC